MKEFLKHKKIVLILITVLILLAIAFLVFDKLKNANYDLILYGDTNITIIQNEKYQEPGYLATLNGKNQSSLVKITNNLNTSVLGTYSIVYEYKDIIKTRKITVINNNEETKSENEETKPISTDSGIDFNINLIKNVDMEKSNYLISPYSIEIAFNMLKSGADGESLTELENVLKTRNIPDLVNDKIKIANAVFIRNTYEKSIEKNYITTLKNKYNSEILYDSFKTPNIINNWVNKKTDGMIEKVIDHIDKDFVLGLANALAIDVKWDNEFLCESTTSKEFTKYNNDKVNVEMMSKEYVNNASYFANDKAKGVIIPYEKINNEQLEFVAILPNSDINSFVSSLDSNYLNNLEGTINASYEDHIKLFLPRFTYDYELKNFIDAMRKMGIKSVFDPSKSNLEKIISKSNLNLLNLQSLYVSTAIHKTHIELSETGTKASAVTYLEMSKSSSEITPRKYNVHEINLNRPFVYIIRDKNTHEILFFGAVYEPNIWKGSTCTK